MRPYKFAVPAAEPDLINSSVSLSHRVLWGLNITQPGHQSGEKSEQNDVRGDLQLFTTERPSDPAGGGISGGPDKT